MDQDLRRLKGIELGLVTIAVSIVFAVLSSVPLI